MPLRQRVANADELAFPDRPIFAVRRAISMLTWIRTLFRLAYICLLSHNNPILWALRERRWNLQSDLEGPYYVLGAPDRTIARGKAVMADLSELRAAYAPFLLTLHIVTPSGEPWPDALIDFWQADSAGNYAFNTYALRGTAKTDADGRLEVLTVPPGRYGPRARMRTAHFHLRILASTRPGAETASLTTQAYICRGNDPSQMASDFANFFRVPRAGNMLNAACIPSPKPVPHTLSMPAAAGSTHFLDLPAFDADAEPIITRSIAWWDELLERSHAGVKVGVVGTKEITISDVRM